MQKTTTQIMLLLLTCMTIIEVQTEKKMTCVDAFTCVHNAKRICGLDSESRELRWFLNKCDLLEFNCEYKSQFQIVPKSKFLYLLCFMILSVNSHGPPQERDNEDIAMGRKMGAKWCNMAKACNHDRVPICGISHAGDVVGFRDLCDMFDYNCIRRRNYRQTACPEDKSMLTVSRRPTNSYYDD